MAEKDCEWKVQLGHTDSCLIIRARFQKTRETSKNNKLFDSSSLSSYEARVAFVQRRVNRTSRPGRVGRFEPSGGNKGASYEKQGRIY